MNWFRNHAVGSHTCEWFAIAMVILLSFALRIVSLRFWLWLLTRKSNRDENDKEYWRIHGG